MSDLPPEPDVGSVVRDQYDDVWHRWPGGQGCAITRSHLPHRWNPVTLAHWCPGIPNPERPISWCRIFAVGPPCPRLCEDCTRTARDARRLA